MDVSKEYVKYQLKSLGMKDLSEEDLEAYTRGINEISVTYSVNVSASLRPFV